MFVADEFCNYDVDVSDQLGLTEGYWARTRLGTPVV